MEEQQQTEAQRELDAIEAQRRQALEYFGHSYLSPDGRAILEQRLAEQYERLTASEDVAPSWQAARENLMRELDMAEGISAKEAFGTNQ